MIGSKLSRLAGRHIPREIRDKTRTFAMPALQYAVRSMWAGDDHAARFRLSLEYGRELGKAMIRAGFGEATHVFTMLGEGGRLLPEAKARGLTVISELYISLSTESILAEERRQFPGWEPDVPDFEFIRQEKKIENRLLKYTDYFICPSEMARDDLVDCWGIDKRRTMLVPYGVDPRWLELQPQPQRGRVLFAGTVELRKGIHYLAMAADKLVARGFRYTFRVAGNIGRFIPTQPVCQHLSFLGRVRRTEMEREFAAADVFVMPSLSETGPEVNYEALACAVPVITTPEAKAIVRDKIDGLIVPSRDPDALADAITAIIEDREKRDQMSRAARERARDYTWDRYGERLIEALKSAPI